MVPPVVGFTAITWLMVPLVAALTGLKEEETEREETVPLIVKSVEAPLSSSSLVLLDVEVLPQERKRKRIKPTESDTKCMAPFYQNNFKKQTS